MFAAGLRQVGLAAAPPADDWSDVANPVAGAQPLVHQVLGNAGDEDDTRDGVVADNIFVTVSGIYNIHINGNLPNLAIGLDGLPIGFNPGSYPDYLDVRDQSQSFASLFAYRLVVATFATRSDDIARRAFGVAVSGNLFDALGVQPAIGRAFGVEEDRPGRAAVVVLDHDTWVREFATDANVLGRTIRIGGLDTTVIGVPVYIVDYP